MNINSRILLSLLFFFAGMTFLSASEAGAEDRYFTIGLSLAYANPSYNEPLESGFNELEKTPGINRVTVGLGLELGFAMTQDLYFMGGIEGMGDRLDDSYDYDQLNTYLYFLGVKGYPFHTGLILEGRIGASRAVVQSSNSFTDTSSTGMGYGATVGYDFDRNNTGVSFETGLSLNHLQGMEFEEVEISNNQLFIYGKLLWK
ncbi:MAG: hypothetical protein B6241_06740 [Spirochaetaceae bacterium 4572_59]|nr:MAG: hypothetical protein B6241_06740 [Spirochaetaceae bacterium 4572_59]